MQEWCALGVVVEDGQCVLRYLKGLQECFLHGQPPIFREELE